MLLLDYQNVLIQSVLTERFSGAHPVSIDQTVSDFDGVTFHLSTPETKSKILISIQVKCYGELVRYGAEKVLEREYGPYVVAPESGYNFSVQVDLDNLPADKEARNDLIRRVSLLKRNAMAAPFEHAFEEHHKLYEEASKFTSEEAPQGIREGGQVMAIHYRDEESIFIKASHDRVTVIFSTIFREETDRVFGKVFIQEFVDARRRAIQNAPQVLFRTDPPLELQDVPGVKDNGTSEIGYVTFVLFPRHLTSQRRDEVISHIQTFRDYFHYHIKASKVLEPGLNLENLPLLKISRHTFIRECAGELLISSKYCGEHVQKTKRRSVRQLVGERSKFREAETEQSGLTEVWRIDDPKRCNKRNLLRTNGVAWLILNSLSTLI